jgi:syntaxin 8
MSLAKLTAISTNTLSLFLERQRLQTLPTDGSHNGSTLHYPQIKRNLTQLREGILNLESKEGSTSEASKLLRSQYDRMRSMLLEEERMKVPRSVICQLFDYGEPRHLSPCLRGTVLIRSNRLRHHCHPK